ncbi:repair protein Rad1/Rec1/Rad17-domain-containing protein [Catenaria anguillulae PL171]|uniref:Repair protein Rad1/Rec1/Rad17-domain-containing protein n=1 Tax=Catenaria anguillulae PL171 TaxID=765915 RepID=A0A1Y2HL71_9FUNG|nr:repair protein Rad1/Rec1/Rad17-domain-containing protein [Catenaria anguillulae PL171]
MQSQPHPQHSYRPPPWTPTAGAPQQGPAITPTTEQTSNANTMRYHPYARPPVPTTIMPAPNTGPAGPTSSIPSPAGAHRHHPSSTHSTNSLHHSGAATGLPASSASHLSFSSRPTAFAFPPGTVFSATLENVRLLAPLLRAVHLRDWISLLLTPRGIRASVSDAAASVQATAYIARNVFRTYQYDPPRDDAPGGEDDVRSSRDLLSPGQDEHRHQQEEQAEHGVKEMQLTVDMPTLLDVLNMYNSAQLHISSASASMASLEAHAAAVAAGIAGSSGSRGGGQPAHTSPGGVTTLAMWCVDPDSAPLQVKLDELGMATTASLHTFSEPEGAAGGLELEAAWEENGPVVYKMIMSASVLRDALSELGVRESGAGAGKEGGKMIKAGNRNESAVAADRIVSLTVLSPPTSTPAATPHATPGSSSASTSVVPQLLLSTSGPAGSATVALAASASMDVFQSSVPEFSATYPAASLDAMMRALALARQVSVRANRVGFLSVQCLVQVRAEVASFIEFVVAPIESDEMDVGGPE